MKISLYNKKTKEIEIRSKIKRITICEAIIIMDGDPIPKEDYSIVTLENEEDI